MLVLLSVTRLSYIPLGGGHYLDVGITVVIFIAMFGSAGTALFPGLCWMLLQSVFAPGVYYASALVGVFAVFFTRTLRFNTYLAVVLVHLVYVGSLVLLMRLPYGVAAVKFLLELVFSVCLLSALAKSYTRLSAGVSEVYLHPRLWVFQEKFRSKS